MIDEHGTEQLGAYALGVLEGDDWAVVHAHLRGCDRCRREVAELRAIEAALGGIPPEIFIEGPPAGADLTLRATLRRVRAEHLKSDTRRRRRWILSAAAVAVLALGAGAAAGWVLAPPEPQPFSAAAPTARTGNVTDAGTGASMRVAVEPAAGWVRVRAAVDGVPAGEQCRLYVVARDGARREAGSWLVSGRPTTVEGSALVDPDEVAAVQVETFAGRVLVSVPV